MINTPRFNQKQSGFYLILMAVVAVTVSASLMTLYIKTEQDKANKLKSVEAGVQLRAFSYGVMRMISDLGPGAVAGTYTGTSWLKLASCATAGTSAVAYLPCSFPNTNRFRDGYTTVITVAGNNVDAVISIPWPKVLGVQSAISASDIRHTAASDNSLIGEYGVTITPAVLGWLSFKDVVETAAGKTIEATASNNAALDIWLRTDGSNNMDAALDMNNNNIINGGTISGTTISGTTVSATGLGEFGELSVTGAAANSIRSNGGIQSVGSISTNGSLDAFGDLFLGPDSADSSAAAVAARGDKSIHFRQSTAGTAADRGNENISITAKGAGDLVITNNAGNAQLIADKIYLEGINRFASQGVYNLTVVENGGSIEQITCPSSLVPQVFTSISGLSHDVAQPIEAFDVETTAIPGPPAEWRFDARLITSGGGLVSAAEINANILVIVKCS